ncbi:helix-turn-helix transcriptional regulator [Dermacoccus nishinomiyaensis]|uniref:helix-turn-helix transcriptional regulator n=1 Tax=Dermacoccus nishinomiyaensis TaxID=1274 RepID=UPI00248D5C96|nr:helix-turn-helix domain-containing protein [Dermacoccus nishinomiyaensis]
MSTTDLVRVPDVAEMLGVNESAVRWLVYTKELPPHTKISNRLVWKRSQIEQYLDDKFAEAEANHTTRAA